MVERREDTGQWIRVEKRAASRRRTITVEDQVGRRQKLCGPELLLDQ